MINDQTVLMEKQEHLSLDKLIKLNSTDRIVPRTLRPQANFIDLMNWVLESFGPLLEDKYLNKYVHNRIIIDGQFLLFCEERDINIECLYKDSIISWKTDGGYEKFFAQGIFLITSKDVKFLHAACFHKGNQHEDEVSFFVICSNKNYEAYVKLRNDFDKWVQERDRSNLHIRVIDGEDIPYTKDHTWDNLFLPDPLKLELKDLVENFLGSKEFYNSNSIPWKRGMILYGKPGCHAKGTPILMYDGSWKNVEEINIGDLLMGPDGQSRKVLELVRGTENMFKISPKKGKSFIVNENHILHLAFSSKQKNLPAKLNISVKDYLSCSIPLRERLKLVKSPLLEFNNDLEIGMDPYLLGVWLGDGTVGKPQITSADIEIIEYCKKYASTNNLNITIKSNINSKAKTINFSHISPNKNIFSEELKRLGIWNKKQIPQCYLTASSEIRLKLLAGIIDTDGSYNLYSCKSSIKYNKIGYKGCFDLIQKDYDLSNQIGNLVMSLGLGFTIKPCIKTIKSIEFSGNYYRMSIYGPINIIPTLLPRKQALLGKYNKHCNRIGINSIEFCGVDDFYGFIVNKDHLYVMDNFWITHNCGKTSIIKTIMSMYDFKPITIIPGASDDAMREAFNYAEEQSPSLLYFEDLDSILETNIDLSSFLNLMDGISAKNGLLIIATANDIKKLKTSVTDRPSRFDRKFEIPTPNQEMAYIYLKRWFGTLLSIKKCKELSKYAEKSEFSYAYLKELYISSMFEALSNNRKVPTEKDIEKSLDRLIKDKNILNNKIINTDKYFK